MSESLKQSDRSVDISYRLSNDDSISPFREMSSTPNFDQHLADENNVYFKSKSNANRIGNKRNTISNDKFDKVDNKKNVHKRRRTKRRLKSSSCSTCSSSATSSATSVSSISSSSSSSSQDEGLKKRKKQSKRHRKHHDSTHRSRRHRHNRRHKKQKKVSKRSYEMLRQPENKHGILPVSQSRTQPPSSTPHPPPHSLHRYQSSLIAGHSLISNTRYPTLYNSSLLHGVSSNHRISDSSEREYTKRRHVGNESSNHRLHHSYKRSDSMKRSRHHDASYSNDKSRRYSNDKSSRYSHDKNHRSSDKHDRQLQRSLDSVYPGLPPPIVNNGFKGSLRHLPTKYVSNSDFSSSSRKYIASRNCNEDGWRLKMRKMRHGTWGNIEAKLIDCHCHLDFLFIKISFFGYIDDYFKAFSDAYLPNFDFLVTVFCNPISLLPDQFRIWSRILSSRSVYASCGIHPHASHYYTEEVEKNLIAALSHPKVRAIGECGIDRSHKNQIHLDIQAKALKSQLKIALKMNKPVVLHARDAYEETLKVVKKVLPAEHRIYLHCYTSSWEMAKEWMSYYTNVMFGFSPLLTFSSHTGVIQTIEKLPITRIMLETDSPYFVPRELYQNTNLCHPGFVYSVAETIAKIKDMNLDEVVMQTERNARTFYDI